MSPHLWASLHACNVISSKHKVQLPTLSLLSKASKTLACMYSRKSALQNELLSHVRRALCKRQSTARRVGTFLPGSLNHGEGFGVCKVRHVEGEPRGGRGLVLVKKLDKELDGIVLH